MPGGTGRKELLAAAGLTCALVASLGSLAGGAAAADPTAGDPRVAPPGENRAAALAGEARAALGDAYAGLRETPDGVGVGVAGSSAEFERARRAFDVPVDRAPVSLRGLKRAKANVFEAAGELGLEPYSVGIDPALGSLRVGSRQLSPSEREALVRAAGGVPIRWSAAPRTKQCKTCYPPYRAGLRMNVGPFLCGGGFTLIDIARDDFYGMTAGHCGRVGRRVRIGGTTAGFIQRNAYLCCPSTSADAAAFDIPAGAARPQIRFHNAPVTTYIPNKTFRRGMQLCWLGARTEGCGLVKLLNDSADLGKHTVRNAVCLNRHIKFGDSGGAVFRARSNGISAAGVWSYGNSTTSCFTKIGSDLTALDLAILVS